MLLSDLRASESLWNVPPSSDLSQYSVLQLVEQSWWRLACSSQAVPALDNSPLMQGDTLRAGLCPGTHFVYVIGAVWKHLVQQYHGGPSLPVHVIRGQPDLSPVSVFAEVTHSGQTHTYSFLLSLQLSLAQVKSSICEEVGLEPVFCTLEVEVQDTWTQLADEAEIVLEAVFPCQLRVAQQVEVRTEQAQTDLSEHSTPRTRSTGT